MIEIRVRFQQQLCGILLLLIIILSIEDTVARTQGHRTGKWRRGLNRSLRILRSEFHPHPTQTHSSYIHPSASYLDLWIPFYMGNKRFENIYYLWKHFLSPSFHRIYFSNENPLPLPSRTHTLIFAYCLVPSHSFATPSSYCLESHSSVYDIYFGGLSSLASSLFPFS